MCRDLSSRLSLLGRGGSTDLQLDSRADWSDRARKRVLPDYFVCVPLRLLPW